MARIFRYGEHVWEDPGEEFSNEDVRRHLTTYFPELAQASIEEKTLEDGTVEVALKKQAGRKGASLQVGKFASGQVGKLASLQVGKSAGLEVGDVVGRLERVGAVELEAVGLFRRLQGMGEVDVATMVELQPEIERAVEGLETYVRAVKQVVGRCLRLRAFPSRSTPAGF